MAAVLAEKLAEQKQVQEALMNGETADREDGDPVEEAAAKKKKKKKKKNKTSAAGETVAIRLSLANATCWWWWWCSCDSVAIFITCKPGNNQNLSSK